MNRFYFQIALVFLTGWLICAATPSHAGLVAQFSVSETAFSPNNDNKQDSTRVRYGITEDAVLLSIIVFESDSTTVVDTLIAPAPKTAGGQNVGWFGTYSNGSPVPEGHYIVTLAAQGTTEPDTSVSLPLFVDLTAPVVQIISIEPNVYTPGVLTQPSTLSATILFSNGSPTFGGVRDHDTIVSRVLTPSGALLASDSLRFEPVFDGVDGLYKFKWTAANVLALTDGMHTLELYVNDTAGFSAFAAQQFDVNKDEPDLKITNVEANKVFSASPVDSLRGWIYDRHVVNLDSTTVRYSSTAQPRPLHSYFVMNDTVFFAIPLADSLVAEKEYTLFFESADLFDRVLTFSFKIRIDKTAPNALTLDPFTGVWHSPQFTLTGNWVSRPDVVRIYRDGTKIDSFVTVLAKRLQKTVTLNVGRNVFFVTGVDEAKNEGPPSNSVAIVFDDGSGMFIPAPFKPFHLFQVNLNAMADRVTIRLYDLAGDLVVSIDELSASKNYQIQWNGRNGSGEGVKKGPLVSVAEVIFPNGDVKIFRELFLFEPGN